MSDHYETGAHFNKIIFVVQPLAPGEYENCIFSDCDFSQALLKGFQFVNCEFKNCNLSLVQVQQAAFREVSFKDCKLMGIRWDQCNPFGLSLRFEFCLLDHSSFYKLKLKETLFRECRLREVDFTETALQESIFERCDLLMAKFEFSQLEGADFSTAGNYVIDPAQNRIKKARFAYPGVLGLLAAYDIEIMDA